MTGRNSPDRAARVQPLVEIIVDALHQQVELVGEEMVGAGDGVVVDGDVPLGAQLVDQLLDRAGVTTSSASPWMMMPDDGQGARKLKSYMLAGGAIEMKPLISGRRIRSCMPIQAPKLTPATQVVSASGWICWTQSSAEAASRQLADAIVERALALADAAEIEAQGGEAAPDESLDRAIGRSCCSSCRRPAGGMCRIIATGARGRGPGLKRPSRRPSGPGKITSGMGAGARVG